jgi:hypothetical protein
LIWQSIGKQSKTKWIILKICCGFYAFSYRFTLRFMAARPPTFFASPKKVGKERRPRLQVWLRQTSLTAHAFGGGR